jgi:hypothetical protein
MSAHFPLWQPHRFASTLWQAIIIVHIVCGSRAGAFALAMQRSA